MAKPIERRSVELRRVLKSLRPALKQAFWITFFVTMISLASVIYMLQVYDRVVATKSMDTLLSLTVAAVAAYLVGELLEMVRKQLMLRATMSLEVDLSERLFRAIHQANLRKVPGNHLYLMRDLGMLRDFMHSTAIVAFLELPSALFFIVIIFIINPMMGAFSLLGLLLSAAVAAFNAAKVDPLMRKAQGSALEAMYYCYEIMRNAQVMHAMGMSKSMEDVWLKRQKRMMAEQAKASDIGGTVMSASKFIALTQSSLLLGLGVLLTIYGLFPGGGGLVIVTSIIGGKALQPIAQMIGSWKSITEARMAFDRIENILATIPKVDTGMPLPAPQGNLSVENLVMGAPGFHQAILRGLTFNLPAGKALVVLGPSGSGKSTLTRAILGVWPAHNGVVRLDGVDVFKWNKDELGPSIGYLPQVVDLFDGTVSENIARFGDIDQAQIEEICKLIGIHEVIMKLPNGYQSEIGDEGVVFSGGQRQRVGLARALYGYPKFIVMDEPNSNLDREAEQTLIGAINEMKKRGSTQVIVTHRPSMIQAADLLMVMNQGVIQMYGPRDDVLAKLKASQGQGA